MIYFDSDVVFNFLVVQDQEKHEQSRRLILDAIRKETFVISTLVVQEVGFGLARFGLASEEIETKLTFLASINTILVEKQDVLHALRLAGIIGFKHINDCVHTVVAERYNPDHFCTYNKSDFKRIKRHTRLEITIL